MSSHEKVANTAVHFFLGHDEQDEDSDDEDEAAMPNLLEMKHAVHVAKKTKARKNKIKKAISTIKKVSHSSAKIHPSLSLCLSFSSNFLIMKKSI